MKIYKILCLSFLFILFSCDGFNEENVPISVNVEDVESILVINGEIEEEKLAWVQISYSEDIDASLSTPINYEINASVSIARSDGLKEEITSSVALLESYSKKSFGTGSSPLLLSVRSGGVVSMPGMLDSILNIGVNDENTFQNLKRTRDIHAWHKEYIS